MTAAIKRKTSLGSLADLPAHAVLNRVVRPDGALRCIVKECKLARKAAFPRPKRNSCAKAASTAWARRSGLARGTPFCQAGPGTAAPGDVLEFCLLSARVWCGGDR